MRTYKSILTAISILVLSMTGVVAQSAPTDGQIVKVDTSANKITIKHGAVKGHDTHDMEEGMTMVYAVKDPAMLASVKAGDKIKFDSERVNGQYTVTKIEKAK